MINIAELLKDCPKGMFLNCTMFNDVKFIRVEEGDKPICIRTGDTYRYLTKFGTWTFDGNAKCIIFPKGKNTWEGFRPPCNFKDGDILFVDGSDDEEDKTLQWIFILDTSNKYGKWQAYCCLRNDDFFTPHKAWIINDEYQPRSATEEEKQKLFDAIKANGYKWNEETKTLEKLVEPKFKVGDRVKPTYNKNMYVIKGITATPYYLEEVKEKFKYSEPIINDKDWELVPDKFDINTLKPFESRVLVRDKNTDEWRGHFFSHYDSNSDRPYVCIGVEGINEYKQCIPYKDNERLLGKTGDCDDFYKNW